MKRKPRTAEKAMLAIPDEWTDVADLTLTMPTSQHEAFRMALEDMEKSGRIEARLSGSPPRVQVRKAK